MTDAAGGNDVPFAQGLAFDASGNPQPPEVMDQGLAFPDGIGIWTAPGT